MSRKKDYFFSKLSTSIGMNVSKREKSFIKNNIPRYVYATTRDVKALKAFVNGTVA